MIRVIGFDGRKYTLKGDSVQRGTCSSLHERARNILKTIFPYENIVEELTLPGSKRSQDKQPLTADFFINSKRLIVEVHGKQHYEYVPHFHKDKMAFLRAKGRDNRKIEWCELNNITIIALSYEDRDEDWYEQIILGIT